jgi:hypothetical protein
MSASLTYEFPDAEGHTVTAGLWQAQTDERIWHLEFSVAIGDTDVFLDTAALYMIEEDGEYLNADGTLVLGHTSFGADDEPIYGPESVMPAAEVKKLVAWAHERLDFKPPRRARLSPLAARLAA